MFNEPHTVWRAEIGGNETGIKNFTYYHVQTEFVIDGYFDKPHNIGEINEILSNL